MCRDQSKGCAWDCEVLPAAGTLLRPAEVLVRDQENQHSCFVEDIQPSHEICAFSSFLLAILALHSTSVSNHSEVNLAGFFSILLLITVLGACLTLLLQSFAFCFFRPIQNCCISSELMHENPPYFIPNQIWIFIQIWPYKITEHKSGAGLRVVLHQHKSFLKAN